MTPWSSSLSRFADLRFVCAITQYYVTGRIGLQAFFEHILLHCLSKAAAGAEMAFVLKHDNGSLWGIENRRVLSAKVGPNFDLG